MIKESTMKSIIFDLDLTLVDSTIAEADRKERNWNNVYTLIKDFTVYEGLKEVFSLIEKHNIKVAIVSTAPGTYIEKVLQYHKIPFNIIVGYHDAEHIKPHPAQMIKALELLGVNSKDVVSFGDRAIDIEASNTAGIESIACFWGTKEKSLLLASSYNHAIINPKEIITLIR